MSTVQIAGCSGAGKTTIAAVFARRGLTAIDADDDPLLARTVDAAANVVEEEPEEPDFAWLSRHRWAWDPVRLDALTRAAALATLYVCGGADNQLELADRFTQVFLLEIDEPTMLARLDARRDYHDWGRIGDTREYLRRKLPELQDRLRIRGDPHRRQAAPRPGGGRDTLPHAGGTRDDCLIRRSGTRSKSPVWKLALRREPGVEPGCDPACCWRIHICKHDRDVAGLRVDPQVPVHAWRAPAVAHRAVLLDVPPVYEPVGVPDARRCVYLSGDQQPRGVGAEQLVAQQRLGEPR